MAKEVLIQTESLVKKFRMGRHELTALDRVNLSFKRGEFTGLVGPSGSGKTTMLNIIGSLDKPTQGRVTIMGKSVSSLTHKEAADLRNRYIGFIFQTFNLFPVYTVYENVEFPLLLLKTPASQRREMVMQALEWVGLDGRADSKPARLSGGESQRVAIARAMVKSPAVVLADEPTANLDAKNSHNILRTMARINSRVGTTFLFSTHDEKVISYLSRKISLFDGRVVEDLLIEGTNDPETRP